MINLSNNAYEDLVRINRLKDNLMNESMNDPIASLKKLIDISIQQTNAQNGYLLLCDKEKITVIIKGSKGKKATVFTPVLIAKYPEIPLLFITSCNNKKKAIHVSNPFYNKIFNLDPYIIKYKPFSLLAIPLKNITDNAVKAILYLENRSKKEVFTPAKLEMLKIFTSHIGNTIEYFDLRFDLESKIKKRTKELIEKNNQVTNLLNNTDQGFLTFKDDLIIEKNYSSECSKIFEEEIGGSTIHNLLYPDNIEKSDFMAQILPKIIKSTDEHKISMYLSLLPQEISIKNKFIAIKYKLLQTPSSTAKIMLIMTDKTEEKNLVQARNRERMILEMVVKIISDFDDFLFNMKDYKNFVTLELFQILENRDISSVDKIQTIQRRIHTYKGNFSLFKMFTTSENLQELENDFFEYKKKSKDPDILTLLNFLSKYNMLEWLEKDLKLLSKILGENFLERESKIKISKDHLEMITTSILDQLSGLTRITVQNELNKLISKPAREMFYCYIDYSESLAEKSGKLLHKLKIKGGQFPINPAKYSNFSRSLVHLFRNSIDHGIETPDERVQAGKDEAGEISVNLFRDDSNINIVISDDGRGIDRDKIKEKAIELGFFTEKDMNKIKDDELLEIIFKDEFTTKKDISPLSGRGVGLSAVKKEVELLKGNIKLNSQITKGTTIHFTIPDEELLSLNQSKISKTINTILDSSISNIQENLNISSFPVFLQPKNKSLQLERFSAFMRLKGIISGTLVLTTGTGIVFQMAGSFLESENQFQSSLEDENEPILEQILAETLNIIGGNSLNCIPQIGKQLSIEPPYTLNAGEATIHFPSFDIYTCNLKTKSGLISLHFICETVIK